MIWSSLTPPSPHHDMPLPVHTRAPPCPGPAFGAAPLLRGGQVSQGPPQTPEIAPQAPRAPSSNLGPGISETTVQNPQAPQHGSLPTPQEAAPRLPASAPPRRSCTPELVNRTGHQGTECPLKFETPTASFPGRVRKLPQSSERLRGHGDWAAFSGHCPNPRPPDRASGLEACPEPVTSGKVLQDE